MGLWALTTEAVQGLARENWGTKIPGQDNQLYDTAVQPAIDELINRLASQTPISMPGTLELIAPSNAPVVNITTNNNNQEILEIVNNVNNETINVTVENITNITEIVNIATNGFTGSVTVVTAVTGGSISISGCTGTVSVTVTTITMTFQNGLCTSAM